MFVRGYCPPCLPWVLHGSGRQPYGYFIQPCCRNITVFIAFAVLWERPAHFLLAGIAPRRVYVASAMGDSWADPIAEQTSAEAARAVYEQLGLDRNHVGSHVRQGGHALSRVDWLRFMEYVEKYL